VTNPTNRSGNTGHNDDTEELDLRSIKPPPEIVIRKRQPGTGPVVPLPAERIKVRKRHSGPAPASREPKPTPSPKRGPPPPKAKPAPGTAKCTPPSPESCPDSETIIVEANGRKEASRPEKADSKERARVRQLRKRYGKSRRSTVSRLGLSATSALSEGKAPQIPNKYRVQDLLGQGGMGQVLLVTDVDIRRSVAMKVLRADHRESELMAERFIEEVQIAGQLEHPNILPIYEMGDIEGEPYFIMKFVEGDSLYDVLSRLRSGCKETAAEYTLIRRLQVFQQLCMGMAYAHDKGVVHRDLKPANIMIGRYGEVLICDWGLGMIVGRQPAGEDKDASKPLAGKSAKTVKPSRKISTTRFERGDSTSFGIVKGTPAYMAPEQARGEVDRFDPRTDVYALGSILFELLTLTTPFVGKNVMATIKMVVTKDPEKPSRVARRRRLECPKAFDSICLKALAKDPADRYQSTVEFAEEIQNFVDGSLERERREREAAEHTTKGYSKSQEYFLKSKELERLRRKLRRGREGLGAQTELEAKRKVWDLEDEILEVEVEAGRLYEAAHDAFDAALGVLPESSSAREAKADLFWEEFVAAEVAGDDKAQRHFKARLLAFAPEKYQTRLEARGSIELLIKPKPDMVSVARLKERDRRLRATDARALEAAESLTMDLRPGAYRLQVRCRGRVPRDVPILVRRSAASKVELQMLGAAAAPKGMILVTGGLAILGGDPDAPSALQREEVEIDDLFLAQYPVTSGEYLTFLNELAERDPRGAQARAPRSKADEAPLWSLGSDGRFSLEALDFKGQLWGERWPIFGLSQIDALAYIKWRNWKESQSYRLPTEREWEYAARGPAGFLYPWGRRFEPGFCNIAAGEERNPLPVGSCEADQSVFGIRDLAGGVREWCADDFDEERGMVVLRGGAWTSDDSRCRSAARIGDQPYDRHLSYGFRLALSVKTGTE